MSDMEALFKAKKNYLEAAIALLNKQVEVFHKLLQTYRVDKASYERQKHFQEAVLVDNLQEQLDGKLRLLTVREQTLKGLVVRIHNAQNDLRKFNQRSMIKFYPSLNYLKHYFRKNEVDEFTYSDNIRNALQPLLSEENDVLEKQKTLEALVSYAARIYTTTFIIGEVVIGAILLSIWGASLIFAPELSMIMLGVMLGLGGLVLGLLHLGKSARNPADWGHEFVNEVLPQEELDQQLIPLSIFRDRNQSYGRLSDAETIAHTAESPMARPT